MVRGRLVLLPLLLGLPFMILAAQSPSSSSPAPAPTGQAAPSAQGAPHRIEPVPGKPVEQVYRNIKALNGLPSEDLILVMQTFRQATGRDCNFCHVQVGNQLETENDSKEEKQTARKMIAMVKAINEQNFNGQLEVTCATCHQGHNDPSKIAPIPDVELLRARLQQQQQARPSGGQQASGAAPTGQQPSGQGQAHEAGAASRPPAAQIFDKYVAAIGGEAAVAKLNTRVTKGSFTPLVGQQSVPLEITQKAPNKVLSQQGPGMSGFDGSKAWQVRGQQRREFAGREFDAVQNEAQFYRDLNPKQVYTQAAVTGRDRVNGHDCWVVRARTGLSQRVTDRLYYDVDSGLLVRRISLVGTPYGPFAQTADYDNYKEFSGVKVPTMVRRYDFNSVLTATITDVAFNTPVDDSRFAAPPAAAPAP